MQLQSGHFIEAEVYAFRDDAIGTLRGRPSPLRTIPIGRLKGLAMVRAAQAIHRRPIGESADA